jgi:hypothetical protein
MFSIVAPIDSNRLEQFKNTKRVYDTMPEVKEFIMPTRSYEEVHDYLTRNRLMRDVRLIPYKHELGFNPSKAFNIGVRESKYDQIIITSPEVKPTSDVLEKLSECIGKNVVCSVSEADESGDNLTLLVGTGYRSDSPAMYFLAMFNKKDIEKINGWDEEFMKGYAYEDNDFGERWNRAGLPFIVRDDITAVHQWHPRSETIPSGLQINSVVFQNNNTQGVIKCKNGLKVV